MTGVVVVCQYVELFFYVIGYIVMMGDNLAKLVGVFDGTVGRFISCLAVCPTIFLKNGHALAGLSKASLAALLIIIACFFFGEFTHEPNSPLNPVEVKWFDWSMVFMAHSSLIAGFSGHAVLPELRGQMQEPKKFGNVFRNVYAILSVAYLVNAFCGYLTFGDETESQLTFNFTGVTQIIVNVCIIFNAFCRVGLTIFPISLFIEESNKELKFTNPKKFWTYVFSFRVVVLFLAFGVSLVLGSLDVVMTVIGIFCASFFVYILSAMLWNNALIMKSNTQVQFNNAVIVVAVILAVFGLLQLFGIWF